jgi:hypothetical protein
MAPSHPSIQSVEATNGASYVSFWADSERTYTLEATDDVTAGPWTKVFDVPVGVRPRMLTVTNAIAADKRYYRLVTPRRP